MASFTELLSAMLTPIIGLLAAYIAYQQYLVNKRKMALDLYDRRMIMYKNIGDYYSKILTSRRTNMDDLLAFYRDCSESHFLFDKEIPKYIETIWEKCHFLAELSSKYYENEPLDEGETRGQILKHKGGVCKWIHDEKISLHEKFAAYLSLTG